MTLSKQRDNLFGTEDKSSEKGDGFIFLSISPVLKWVKEAFETGVHLMPRLARCAMANMVYHLIHRGNNKQVIFFSDEDHPHFLELVQEAKVNYPVKLYAYVLMSNHIHLLVEP